MAVNPTDFACDTAGIAGQVLTQGGSEVAIEIGADSGEPYLFDVQIVNADNGIAL